MKTKNIVKSQQKRVSVSCQAKHTAGRYNVNMDAYHSPPDKETTNSYPRDGGPGEGSSQLQSHCFASALGLQSRCEVSTVLWEHWGPPTRCWLIKRKGGNVRALKNSSHNDQNNQLFSHHLCFIQLGFLTKIDFPL